MKNRLSRRAPLKSKANRNSQRRSRPVFEGLDSRTLMSVTFAPSVEYPVVTDPRSVAVGDFNGDGHKDLVSNAHVDGLVSVLLGNGDGTFQPRADYFAGFNGTWCVAVGDFNTDGRQDLVITGIEASFSLLFGNGDGTFQARQLRPGRPSHYVAVGDLNADGKLDLAMAHNDNVSAMLGNGNGTFQTAVYYLYDAEDNNECVAIADLNGDGQQDLAAVSSNTNSASVLIGNGNGTFQAPTVYPVGAVPYVVVAKDLNGDGRRDLITANSVSDNASVLLGNGNGTFQSAVEYAMFDGPRFAVVEDFDLDGKLDLAVTNTHSSNVALLVGNGDGTFQPAVGFGVSGYPGFVASSDFNGDGRLDLVTAPINATFLSVLLNTSGLNDPPTITRNLAAVSVNEGSLATNTGTFYDAQGRNTVTLTASLGTVTKNDTTGVWNWSYTPTDQTAAPVTVTITATDTSGLSATATFTLATSNVAPTITGFNVPATATEGGSTMLVASANDPAGANDPLTFTWTVTRPDATTATLVGSSVAFPFGDNGNYGVSLAVTDGDGGTATRTATIAVANVAPTILTYTVPTTGNEGTAVAFSATAFDPAGASDPLVYTWTITKPDASTSTVTGASGNFIPADQGNYSVVLRVTDGDGGQLIRPASTVVVSNVAPTITTFTVPTTGTEGSTINFSAAATDPAGANDPLSYTWTVTHPSGTTTTLTGASPTFTAPDNGSYGVSLTVTDGDGGTATRTGSIAVANVAPTINSFILAPTGFEGSPLNFSAAATDPAGANDPLTYTWTITRPGGTTTSLTGATPSFTPTDNGTHGVSLTVSDGDGGNTVRTGSVAITNVAPTINTFTVPTTGTEGTVVSLIADATDPAGANDPLTYAWTVTRPNGTITSLTGANASLVLTDNGIHGVSLTVSDGDGGTATRTASITASNVAPTINTFTVPTTGNEGSPLNLSAAATDPAGPFDPLSYSWTITRPDGSTTTLVGANQSFAPADNGIHGVSLTVSDGDGGTAVRTASIAVANVIPTPELGTGGGGTALQVVPVSPITPPRLPSPLFSGMLMASDPSSADEAAGFEYRVDWGDSSPLQTFARTAGNGDGIAASHQYATAGTYTIYFGAIDKDGGVGTVTRTVTVGQMSTPAERSMFVQEPPIFSSIPVSAEGETWYDADELSSMHALGA